MEVLEKLCFQVLNKQNKFENNDYTFNCSFKIIILGSTREHMGYQTKIGLVYVYPSLPTTDDHNRRQSEKIRCTDGAPII